MLLAIDTSAGCEAALVDRTGRVLAERRFDDDRHHAEAVGIAIRDVLAEAGAAPAAVEEVVAGMGPGPFTGLRVGVAAARAVALARGVPCTPVPSHDAIAHAWRAEHPGDDAPLLVVTDVRRRQVAVSRYAPGRAAASGAPELHAADELPATEGARIVTANRVRAPHLALALLDRRAAGEPEAADELLYLRAPDAVPSAGPKRVTA